MDCSATEKIAFCAVGAEMRRREHTSYKLADDIYQALTLSSAVGFIWFSEAGTLDLDGCQMWYREEGVGG